MIVNNLLELHNAVLEDSSDFFELNSSYLY